MLDVTPQERLALTVLAVLLTGGAVARHAVSRADARHWLQYSAETADTLNPAFNPALRVRAEAELALEQARNTPLQPGERIDPNLAPPEQLERLPRIGPALADRIVEYRLGNGPFRTVGDLQAVTGIGPSLLEGIAPYLDLGPTAARGARAGPHRDVVDINRASVDELQALPGVGPAIAGRIVDYRRANGPFASFDELENVSGIGPRLRERLQGVARL